MNVYRVNCGELEAINESARAREAVKKTRPNGATIGRLRVIRFLRAVVLSKDDCPAEWRTMLQSYWLDHRSQEWTTGTGFYRCGRLWIREQWGANKNDELEAMGGEL